MFRWNDYDCLDRCDVFSSKIGLACLENIMTLEGLKIRDDLIE